MLTSLQCNWSWGWSGTPGAEHPLVLLQVVVNLYPFRATVTATPAPAFEVGVENIDIGGPTMIR